MRKEDRENLVFLIDGTFHEVNDMVKGDTDPKKIIDRLLYTLQHIQGDLESYHQSRKEQIELEKELFELKKHSNSNLDHFDLKKLNQEFNS